MSSELLEKNQHQLVRVLSSLSVQDFLKLSRNLQKHRVIPKEGSNFLASLDYDNLDSNTTVRYLLHVVGERVKVDNTLCAQFLKALTGFRNVGVAQVGESLVRQAGATSQCSSEASPVLETVYLEKDLRVLSETLTSGSHKWEEFSVTIGLPEHIIEECRSARSNNLRLYRSLKEWVCGKHDNARHPSLSQLKQALSSPFVGLPDLALKIEKSWKTNSDHQNSHFADTVSEPSKIFNISLEPSDTAVADEKSTLLEVQVSCSEAVTYQCIKEEQPLSDSSSFTGTQSSMLLIHKAGQGVQGEYYCQINLGSVQLSTSPVQVTVTFPPDKQCLLNLYSCLKEVPQDSWPIVGPNTFVDVALIDTRKSSRKPSVVEGEVDDILQTKKISTVSLVEAFSQYQEGSLIILEGHPGSGKTTLTFKMTKDWVNGKMLRKANKVFLVSLRKDYDKVELFKSFYQSKAQAYVEQLEECGGKGSCFILDGYDEFSNSQGDQSVINQLIHKAYLPLAMVILTSRPVATATLRPKATERFECLGFTKKCFQEFVNSYPFHSISEDDQSDTVRIQLMGFLKSSSNVLNMCYLPFNASMICFLFDQFREIDNVPKTETEIYKLLILAIALRKLRIVNFSAQLQSLECLSDSDKVIYKELCLLAFNMTIENKQILKIPVSLESLNSSCLCGLLTIESTIRIAGLENTLVFLHLTLQEYLAACHLARQDKDQQTEMIRLHSGKDHMLTMFKFYCGLVDFQTKLQQFDDIVSSIPNMLYAFHCAYETQLVCVCVRAMEILNCEIFLESGVLTPADFTVLAYVISNAPHLVNSFSIMPCLLYEEFIDDKWKNKDIAYADVLSSSFKSSINTSNVRAGLEYDLCTQVSYHSKGTLNKEDRLLDLLNFQIKKKKMMFECSSDVLSSDGATSLVKALENCSNIEAIGLVGNFSSMRSASFLNDVLKCCCSLKEFLLYGDLSSSEMKLLTHGLQHCKSLHKLDFSFTNLSNSLMEISSILVKAEMRELHLIQCNINSDGADILAGGLATNSLDKLTFSYNDIGPNGMKSIAENTLCKELKLYDCNIGPEGAKHLSRSILLKPVLTSLNLADNGIDSISTIALAEGLNHCCNLQELCLSLNNVGYDGAVALAQCLQSCSNLRRLTLNSCSLEGDGIVRLAEQFHSWTNMEVLGLSNNGVISDGDMFVISGGIQHLYLLQILYLSNNSIDNAAAIVLAEGIQSCPLLNQVYISKNLIGSYGASVLAQSMKCSKINYLDFSNNLLDDMCIESFVALVLTSQLLKLDLSHNIIGSTGSNCLVSNLLDCQFSVEVNLASNNISPDDMTSITQLLQRNIHLHILLK